MSQAGETFFTSVGCMDGRVQEPVLAFGRKIFGVKYADMITEAGLVGLLSRGVNTIPPLGWKEFVNSLKSKILISLEKHHSKGIVIHGHEDCAGNPVSDSQHKKDVLKAAKTIGKLIQKDTQIIPVFVKRQGVEWVVEMLK